MCGRVFSSVFAARAMLHLCTSLPPAPVSLSSVSQASSRPEPSIKLASYREQWSCGVCLGQHVHINLFNRRPTRTATVLMMLLSLTKVFMGGKKKVDSFLGACNVSLSQCAVSQMIWSEWEHNILVCGQHTTTLWGQFIFFYHFNTCNHISQPYVSTGY